MDHKITEGLRAKCNVDAQGQVCITFFDPAYVRSDLIIFDRKDSSLHAVLHECSHLIGRVDTKLHGAIAGKTDVMLTAPHYFSGNLNLKAKLSVC